MGLLNSFPSLRGPRRELAGIPGSPPDLLNPPPGCAFLPRCAYGTEACTHIDMTLATVRGSADPTHITACPFVQPGMPAPGVSPAAEPASLATPGVSGLAHALAPDAATALSLADGLGAAHEEPER
jgi:peptide/nickel transport system ATP-binding protein